MADLSTSYLGLSLKTPIIAASSSLTSTLSNVKKCEDAGAGAVVLKSLFEEQITLDKNRMIGDMNFDAYTDAYDFFNAAGTDFYLDEYLGLVEDAKNSVKIPFSSLNSRIFLPNPIDLFPPKGTKRRIYLISSIKFSSLK